MSLKQENSNKQADVGLGAAIRYYSSQGMTVSLPLRDSQDYDLVVDDGKLKRVQVKTATSSSDYGVPVAYLKTNGGNRSGTGKVKKFNNKKVEILFILTNDDMYSIPSKKVKSKTKLNLGKEMDKYKVLP